MLMAQLRGKTRDEAWLTSEDLLTSAVFGTLKNLPDEIAIGLLATAQAVNGAGGPTLQRPLRWTFWPWWDNCEPDVVVEDEHSIVVIEVKLNAEFGTDTGQGPQLEREWRAGSRRAHVSSKKLFLITVTNHTMPPSTVILQQLAGTQAPTDQVAWLGWQDIVRYIAGLRARPQISGWADDLLALFDRMALRFFQGFGQSVVMAQSIPSTDTCWLSRTLVGTGSVRRAWFRTGITLSLPCSATWHLGHRSDTQAGPASLGGFGTPIQLSLAPAATWHLRDASGRAQDLFARSMASAIAWTELGASHGD